jgi:hypothetical protein
MTFTTQHQRQLRGAITIARRVAADELLGPEDLPMALYHGWYARPVCAPIALDPTWPPLPGLLRASHAGSDQWQDGWRTLRTDRHGVVRAWQDAGAPHALPRGSYTHTPDEPDRTGLLPRPGDTLIVLDRRDALAMHGWWRTWGEQWDPVRPPADAIRIYLSLRTEALATATTEITSTLIDTDEPWLLKIALDPAALRRADAAVLYLPPDSVNRLSDELWRLLRRIRPMLRSSTAPLTHQIAPGVATAEEPGDGQSFGEHRCALIARALNRAAASWAPLTAIAEAFLDAGVDPAAPHRSTAGTSAGQPWI